MKLGKLMILLCIVVGSIGFSATKSSNKSEVIVKNGSFCTGIKTIGFDGVKVGPGNQLISRFYETCNINGKIYSGTISVNYRYIFKETVNGKEVTYENRIANGDKYVGATLTKDDVMKIKEGTKIKISKLKKGTEILTRTDESSGEYVEMPVDYIIEMNGNLTEFPIIDQKS